MPLSSLDISGSSTHADHLKCTFEERSEVLKGKLIKMGPAPHRIHQGISSVLHYELYDYLKGKECGVYSAPLNVHLPHKTKADKGTTAVVQRDTGVICDMSKLDARWVHWCA